MFEAEFESSLEKYGEKIRVESFALKCAPKSRWNQSQTIEVALNRMEVVVIFLDKFENRFTQILRGTKKTQML